MKYLGFILILVSLIFINGCDSSSDKDGGSDNPVTQNDEKDRNVDDIALIKQEIAKFIDVDIQISNEDYSTEEERVFILENFRSGVEIMASWTSTKVRLGIDNVVFKDIKRSYIGEDNNTFVIDGNLGSKTMLYAIKRMEWEKILKNTFGVPVITTDKEIGFEGEEDSYRALFRMYGRVYIHGQEKNSDFEAIIKSHLERLEITAIYLTDQLDTQVDQNVLILNTTKWDREFFDLIEFLQSI